VLQGTGKKRKKRRKKSARPFSHLSSPIPVSWDVKRNEKTKQKRDKRDKRDRRQSQETRDLRRISKKKRKLRVRGRCKKQARPCPFGPTPSERKQEHSGGPLCSILKPTHQCIPRLWSSLFSADSPLKPLQSKSQELGEKNKAKNEQKEETKTEKEIQQEKKKKAHEPQDQR
jgi:hypothetical protein